MALLIYFLCTLTSLMCAWMLLKRYFYIKLKILLWSGLCFTGLFISNIFLMIDALTGPGIDLSTVRLMIGLISLVFLLFGLIWEDNLT